MSARVCLQRCVSDIPMIITVAFNSMSQTFRPTAGSYPLDRMDFMESGIFGFLMKNWIDSAKKIRASPKFAFRGQMDRGVGT